MFTTNVETMLVPFLVGISSHILYFGRGEHHTLAKEYFQLVSSAPVIGAIAGATFLDVPIVRAFGLTLYFESIFMAGLFTSIIIYRALFHRLRKFPGPFSWRLSKLVQAWDNRDLMNYKHLDANFRQYGEYVRTGPNELTTIDPDACNDFIQHCGRGTWYDGGKPELSLLTTRLKQEHDPRRRVWDKGFGARALRDYEPRVAGHVVELSAQIRKRTLKSLDFSEWINYFSFDVMGDLAFARSFEILPNGKKPYQLKLLEESQKPLGVFGPVPWLAQILRMIPGMGLGYKRFRTYCSDLMDERIKMDIGHDDITSWLIDGLHDETRAGASKKKQEEELVWLRGDSRLIVVAGSDTTAATLSFCMYYLCANPVHAERIRAEVSRLTAHRSATPATTGETFATYDARDLQNKCEYMNGFINEALRMHPPVPGGFMRQTPPEGLVIQGQSSAAAAAPATDHPAWLDGHDAKPANGVFLPGGVNVWMPVYTLGRNPRAFTEPDSFAPARWIAQAHRDAVAPKLAPEETGPQVLRKEAFLPFSAGGMGCVGKQLALQEIRLVLASLVTLFDAKFAPGEDGHGLIHDTRDWFTLGLAPLNVVFEERKQSVDIGA